MSLPNPMRYARDILRDRGLMWVNRMYYCWVALGVLLPGIVLGLVRAGAGTASHPDACGAVFCESSSLRSLYGASIPYVIRSVPGRFERASTARTTPCWHCRRAARLGTTIIMPSPSRRVSGTAGGNWT